MEDNENEDETTEADIEDIKDTKNIDDTEEREKGENGGDEVDATLVICGRRGMGALSLLTSNISLPPIRKRLRR
jgi:hypothetical protein